MGYRLPTVKELGQAESQERGDGHWASAMRTGESGKDPTLSTSDRKLIMPARFWPRPSEGGGSVDRLSDKCSRV